MHFGSGGSAPLHTEHTYVIMQCPRATAYQNDTANAFQLVFTMLCNTTRVHEYNVLMYSSALSSEYRNYATFRVFQNVSQQ